MKLENSTCSFSIWFMFLLMILLCSMSFLQPSASATARTLTNETDKLALLQFKESIFTDPDGVLTSWNDSVHFCNWRGITCGKRHQRIIYLNLKGYNLHGTISPYIGNLSFLRFINLGSNSFSGEIPHQVGHLFRLQQLNLSYNMLEGKIPVNLTYCSKLGVLDFQRNKLSGSIPVDLGSLAKLVVLHLNTNNLTGCIPASLGNLTSLKIFSVAINNFIGNLPNELGKLKSLTFFSIGSTTMSGTIPPSLYNVSSMRVLSITDNHFSGIIPPNIGLTLPNLQLCALGGNEFFGMIPESFSNASQLQVIDIGGNNFVGQIPSSFGNLPDLRWLLLASNSLGSYSANSLDFITSLRNCSRMERLDISLNNFGGILPTSVANLSTQISSLRFSDNKISGEIPTSLANLFNLIYLGMWNNLFTGSIPVSLCKLQNLGVFDLGTNALSGRIPLSIGNLTRIYALDLSYNKLEGTIPLDIGNCQMLQYLYLSGNKLDGSIPKEIFGLSSVLALEFSENAFSGNLQSEVHELKTVSVLNFANNNLTGKIPETIGDCQSLEFFDLHGNFFQGSLPSTLSSLRGLQYLDLSQNNLTGQIPKDLQKLRFLSYFNLSFNDLYGEVPKDGVFQNTSELSLVGNTKLCGGVQQLQLPRCPMKESNNRNSNGLKKTIAIVSVVAVFLFLLVSCFVFLYWRRKSQRKSSTALSEISILPNVSYEKLFRATNGFSPSMLIGAGSFGSVYRGTFDQEEDPIAIKVLSLQQKGAEKSFVAECNALRNIKHRNLVKVLTCCSSLDYSGNEFKALVFEHMSNGSLEKWLHFVTDGENRSRSLNQIQRLNIAIDVASAMCYLHEDCDQLVIHCDLKPSNVLLDNDMVAHVSDFGLARLISNTTGFSDGQTSTIGIKGTIGYAAPEYSMGGQPSRDGDVYSYGILVLEMFTGKRPTDEMFKDDFNLHNFVKIALPERLVQVVDSTLLLGEVEETAVRRESGRNWRNNGGIEVDAEGNINFENQYKIGTHLQKCLVSVLKIGLACSEDLPYQRMKMRDVTSELQRIRDAYLEVGIHG